MSGQERIQLLQEALDRYEAYDEREASFVARIQTLLEYVEAPFARDTRPAHVTASAILYWADTQQCFQIWHLKEEQWFQPGGHVEPIDTTVQAGALRELVEETGFTVSNIVVMNDDIFDVDIHPVGKGDDAHEHFDVRYLFTLNEMQQPDPESDGRWVDLTELENSEDISQGRYAKKLQHLLEK